MRLLKKLVFCLVIFSLLSLLLPSYNINAQESTSSANIDWVKNEVINPMDGSKYFVKRLKENWSLFFTFNKDKKAEIYSRLSDIRLAELKYVIEKKDPVRFEDATKRYYTTVGKYAEFLSEKSFPKEVKDKARDQLDKHKPVITVLQTYYNDTTAEWRFLKHDADYLDIYIGKLQN